MPLKNPPRSPSVRALRPHWGYLAPRLKEILRMNRQELEATDAGAARVAGCYHPPSLTDLRMTVLNATLALYGVESFNTRAGRCTYLNTGDTYAPTLVWFQGAYRLTDWGTIAERYELVLENSF